MQRGSNSGVRPDMKLFTVRKRRTENLTNCSLQVNVLLVDNSEGGKRNGLEVIFYPRCWADNKEI